MNEAHQIQTKQVDGKIYVFDMIRKKYLLLTPEEKVRQVYLLYLIHECGVPTSRIRCEFQLEWNALIRRCDIVVFDQDVNPILIVECKKEGLKISERTLDQLARYNLKLQVKYLVATNLVDTYTFVLTPEKSKFELISELPKYDKLI